MTLESQALYYASQGIAVIPVAQDCKPGRLYIDEHQAALPPDQRVRIAVGQATADTAQIRRWWALHPDAQVSICTGGVSGLWVLDVDAKDGFDGFADLARLRSIYGPMPETWCARTPSGGEHLYWRYDPARPLTNKVHFKVPNDDGEFVKSGLDVRTNRACAAAPPSRKPAGAYTWIIGPAEIAKGDLPLAPDWLLELIDPPPPPAKPREPLRFDSFDRAARYVAAALERECGDLASMGAGSGRNLALFQASANLAELVGARLLSQSIAEDALERAATENGLVRDDGIHSVRASIRSGFNRGIQRPRELRL